MGGGREREREREGERGREGGGKGGRELIKTLEAREHIFQCRRAQEVMTEVIVHIELSKPCQSPYVTYTIL